MKYRFVATFGLLAAAYLSSSTNADAAWLSNPHTVVSGNCASGLVLGKELSGYNNYGQNDGRADVLYSGDVGSWTFADPCGDTDVAYLQITVALDDHYDVPVGNYELDVYVNGKRVTSGYADDLGLRHGAPYGQRFGNWQHLWVQVKPAGQYRIDIHNRSGLPQEHWIAIDRMSLHLEE